MTFLRPLSFLCCTFLISSSAFSAPGSVAEPFVEPRAGWGKGAEQGDTLPETEVPPFASGSLVTWGPLPPGREHPQPERTADLTHQTLRVAFDWTRKAVIGTTSLQFVAIKDPVSSVTLDAINMAIKDVTIDGKTVPFQYDSTRLAISFPKPATQQQPVVVTVSYETVNPRKGAYFIDRKKVLWTQGEMIETRHWVPTIDRPDDKTTWDFYITVPKSEKALSNGRLVGTRDVGTDSTEWHWSQEQNASTYHFSIVTGNYEILREEWDGIPIGYWTYPDSVEAAKRGFKGTPHMMEVYSRLTGVRYPWAKYDQSAVPDFIFGGMENVSATTQNDRSVLIPAAQAATRDAQGLVSHELAHQWFGNIVTLKDWSHAWLNEGFATFLETIYYEESDQPVRAALNRLNDQRQAMGADRRARRPLVYGAWDRDPVELFFSGHIYPKGAAVLDQLRFLAGDALFWKSINTYLTTHAYGSVVTDDLRAAFERTTKRNLKPFFDEWIYKAGFPAFQISQTYDARKKQVILTARQVQPTDSLTPFFTTMDVDVEVWTAEGAVRKRAEVRGETTTIAIPVKSAPLAVTWDPESRWLQIVDFPRSTAMLGYQLAHGGVLARMEAIEQLVPRVQRGDTVAREALRQAEERETTRELKMRLQSTPR